MLVEEDKKIAVFGDGLFMRTVYENIGLMGRIERLLKGSYIPGPRMSARTASASIRPLGEQIKEGLLADTAIGHQA